jgi:hypothetical protein
MAMNMLSIHLTPVTQAKTAAECSYLEGGGPDGLGPALRHISLYHSSDDGRGRGCFCVLLPATGRCLVVVLVPNGIAAKEVTPAALDKAWKDTLAGLAESGYMQQEQVRQKKSGKMQAAPCLFYLALFCPAAGVLLYVIAQRGAVVLLLGAEPVLLPEVTWCLSLSQHTPLIACRTCCVTTGPGAVRRRVQCGVCTRAPGGAAARAACTDSVQRGSAGALRGHCAVPWWQQQAAAGHAAAGRLPVCGQACGCG